MHDLPTLETALKLADQDSPLPSLAGPALKVLRENLAAAEDALFDLLIDTARLSGYVRHAGYSVGVSFENGSVGIATLIRHDGASKHVLGNRMVVANRYELDGPKRDSATLATLIAELRVREAVGRKKYGTDVDRADLTNTQWRQHLREELMDALLYSLAEEHTALPTMADLALQGRIRPIHLAEECAVPMEVVECGGSAPAVGATPVRGTDHGGGDITVEVFGYVDSSGVIINQIIDSDPATENNGHGHVRARPDGLVAKCGGPELCRICAKDLADTLATPGDKRCWCETCYPSAFLACHMMLCPTCGNKRCPHAHDHRNVCTGSNAVGQPGSSWEHVNLITPDSES